MAIDTKHEDLQSLRIDRTQRGDNGGEPPAWARRYILGGIAVVVLLGLIALAYRVCSPPTRRKSRWSARPRKPAATTPAGPCSPPPATSWRITPST